MAAKKTFVLRLDEDVYKALERWAADEFRSVNGQLEWMIDTQLKQAGRKKEVKDKNKENSKDDIEVVFIKIDNKAKIRKVKTGIQDDKYIQILEGIRDEDIIISGPYSAVSKILNHDDDIKEVSKDQLFDAKKKED